LSADQQPADQVAFCQPYSELNAFLVNSQERKFIFSDSILNPGALRTSVRQTRTSVRQMSHACIPHLVEKHIGPTLRQARYAFEASLKDDATRYFPLKLKSFYVRRQTNYVCTKTNNDIVGTPKHNTCQQR
jgi:hypothetical protein